MVLVADLTHFLDEKGNPVALTKQAEMIFTFLAKIVSSVSKQLEQPRIDVDVKCNTRAEQLSCGGSIAASCITIGIINWHCDTCEASGTISNWQSSQWDKQQRTMH